MFTIMVLRYLKILLVKNKNLINFFSNLKLEKSTQIQIWKDVTTLPEHSTWQEYLSNITRDGYPAILSSPWYLNFISYGYRDWYRYYEVEPLSNFTGN